MSDSFYAREGGFLQDRLLKGIIKAILSLEKGKPSFDERNRIEMTSVAD